MMARYSSCPWLCVLVRLLQVSGSFVHTWPRSQVPFRPVPSVPLGLWALFVNVWTIAMAVLYCLTDDSDLTVTDNIGNNLYFLSWKVLLTGMTLSYLFLLFRGRNLVEVMVGLDDLVQFEDQGNLPKKKRSSYFLLLIAFILLILVMFRRAMDRGVSFDQNLLVSVFEFAVGVKASVLVELFSVVFERLANAAYLSTRRATSNLAIAKLVQDEKVPGRSRVLDQVDTRLQDLMSLSQIEKDIGQVSGAGKGGGEK